MLSASAVGIALGIHPPISISYKLQLLRNVVKQLCSKADSMFYNYYNCGSLHLLLYMGICQASLLSGTQSVSDLRPDVKIALTHSGEDTVAVNLEAGKMSFAIHRHCTWGDKFIP